MPSPQGEGAGAHWSVREGQFGARELNIEAANRCGETRRA